MNAITELEVLKYLISLVNEDKGKPVSGVSSDMQERALSYLLDMHSYIKWLYGQSVDTSEKRVEEKEN
jgi:hypothetical protein